ncbi:hypothetical protein BDW62DRAFT_220842 [Aspergillus aurantiobrunneus]
MTNASGLSMATMKRNRRQKMTRSAAGKHKRGRRWQNSKVMQPPLYTVSENLECVISGRGQSTTSVWFGEALCNPKPCCSAAIACRSEFDSGCRIHRAFTSRMALGQGSLSCFPFLTIDEFEGACRAFLDRVHVAGTSAVGWSSIRFQGTGPFLKISQNLSTGCRPLRDDALARPVDNEDSQDSQLEKWEEDPEAFMRTHDLRERLQVDYDILLSPTYQVPILYFVLRHAEKPLGMDEVYNYLVPDQYRENIKSVGIMGGISFGYHPLSGTPAFFVHPCNTADAMKNIASGHGISPEMYLIIWLGLVGNYVRLHLPSELFAAAGIPELSA